MRTSSRLAGVLAGAVLLSACATGGTTAAPAATVNGEEIPLEVVEAIVKKQVAEAEDQLAGLGPDERNEQVATLQRDVLTGLIAITLIEQLGEERGLEVTAEQVEERWQDEIGLQGGEEALLDLIDSIGLTEEQARRQLKAGLLREAVEEQVRSEVEISDEEVRQAYDARGGDVEQVRASHILVDTEEEAEEILTLLDDGEAFEELAMERSTGPSGPNGGALGLAARGAYVPEFDDAVWAAEAGDIVGPVQTQFGFHVIRVEEFVTTTFADQEESIRAELQGAAAQGAIDEVIRTLFQEAEIEVDSRFGVWDVDSGRVVADGGIAPELDTP